MHISSIFEQIFTSSSDYEWNVTHFVADLKTLKIEERDTDEIECERDALFSRVPVRRSFICRLFRARYRTADLPSAAHRLTRMRKQKFNVS